MKTVLLIDDDDRLGPPLAEYFQRFDLELLCETHPTAGLARLDKGGVDLVILDVMLPDQDGFQVCRTIRKDSEVPIIMLTARGEVTDRVVGLELGADDYLAKPFEPRELVARIQNIFRRIQPQQKKSNELDYGDLRIDNDQQLVWVVGDEIALTTREYQLLCLLAENPSKNFSRDEIINRMRGTESELFSRAVDILVSRLRQKLKPTDHIKTVWGAGYRFTGSKK
ncbi:MAG: two-component system OmpR family response regulator [Gammaproteobacteria bacterium]|jgi:two-component system OmpR family response regulator